MVQPELESPSLLVKQSPGPCTPSHMNHSPEICQESDRKVMKNEMLRCVTVRLLRSAINSVPGIEIKSMMVRECDR